MKISIIIPAYNESERIEKTLDVVYRYLSLIYRDFEICVVNDGSSDSTVKVIQNSLVSRANIKLFNNERNRGKGYAVRFGLGKCTGDIIIFLDADLAVPVYEISGIIQAIQAGADMAIGARYTNDNTKKLNRTRIRNILSRTFNLFTRLATGLKFKDTQCGLKGMTRATAKLIIDNSRFDRFGFDVEWLWVLQSNNRKIIEVPVSYTDIKGSKIHIIKTSFLMLCDLVKLFFRRKFTRTTTEE